MKWFVVLCFLSGRLMAQGDYDVCVYGGTSAGVIAAYTAQQMHKKVILIEPGHHLGGLSSGGLGYTDIGNKYAIMGLSLDFYRRIGKHYGTFEQWIFEPHVAEDVYAQYVKAAGLHVLYGYRIVQATRQGTEIKRIRLEPTPAAEPANNSGSPNAAATPNAAVFRDISAKEFIDCSYEGDLMAKAGVSYVVGREANSVYDETYDGVQLREKHQFPDGVDPYKTPGDPSSGLLYGISPEPLAPTGTGDKKVQSYNYRICLTDDPANRIAITQPERYDPTRYQLLLRYLAAKPSKDLWGFLKFDLLPNHKTDINNNGPFSTDMIGNSYDYPDAGYATRSKIIQQHIDYTKGLLYFIGHDPQMPEHLRKLMLEWGYPKDEYTDNGHWTPQLYVREARRMVGAYVMTQANCEGKVKVEDGIGLAAYTMDSHNCQRIVVNGMVKNEGDVQIGGFPPYPISYRAIVPKRNDCSNLLVPVCLSASHIAYGSIRMEPVFMELGQSAAIAAGLAIDNHLAIQDVDAARIRRILKTDPLADGSTPEIIVDNDDSANVVARGNWVRQRRDSYGFSRLADTTLDGSSSTVRFTVDLIKAGRYDLYIYVPKLKNLSTYTTVLVNGRELQARTGGLLVEGQTSGQWVKAGTVELTALGKNNYVEISDLKADGVVVADAILLTPGR
ncbi:MAG TPA: FAD-dependent oxidoreductase [Puia sp.]|nr:FAD-dependent oxidoreductase [Puia sp.]